MSRFSIIIPVHNRERFIEAAIRSVLAQNYHDYELIVCDDGSTDATPQIIAQHAANVKLVTTARRGAAAARNEGARHARGAYLAFLDSDDLWMPWTLDVTSRIVDKVGGNPLIYAKLHPFHSDVDLMDVHLVPTAVASYTDLFSAPSTASTGAGAILAIPREVFVRAGGFDESLRHHEDFDLALRLGTHSPYVEVCQPVTVAYRAHGEQSSRHVQAFYAAMVSILDKEQAGLYPGGRRRQDDRGRFIGFHAQACSIALMSRGNWRHAWSLYLRTLRLNFRTRSLAYLASFPLYPAYRLLRQAIRTIARRGTPS